MNKTPKRILWWGNVRNLTFAQRVDFARTHGFDALNISPFDVEALIKSGENLGSIRNMVEDEGVRLTYLDPVVDWLPKWSPSGAARKMIPFLEAGAGRTFEFANELGIDRILAVTCFPKNRYEISEIAGHLNVLAGKAETYGITVVLEAMPMWGLKHFSEIVALRNAVDRENVKLLFDTWHYCRGDQDDGILRDLEAGAIDHVQIADGTLTCPPDMDIFDDCLEHRLAPGDGELPISKLLGILAETGNLNSVGPEVFSAKYDLMSADQIAQNLLPGFESAIAGTGLNYNYKGAK